MLLFKGAMIGVPIGLAIWTLIFWLSIHYLG
jgi:hypothetical protein